MAQSDEGVLTIACQTLSRFSLFAWLFSFSPSLSELDKNQNKQHNAAKSHQVCAAQNRDILTLMKHS